MSNSNDEFQLMLNQIDMETQIVEYQDFISGQYQLRKSGINLLDIIGNANNLVDLAKSFKPEIILEASIKDEVKQLVDQGKVIFKELKSGQGFAPVLYAAEDNVEINGKIYGKNKIVSQVKLNERAINPDIANAINNYVVNQQLIKINSKLDEMNKSLGTIEQGQRNDRIALVYSAEEKMKEALATKDEHLKRELIANAISTANDARFQLMETLKTDVRDVIVGTKATSPFEAIEVLIKGNAEITASIIDKIRTAFFYINMSTSICAQGYMLLDEKAATQKSIDVYKSFINDMFIKNDVMSQLQLYDKNVDNMWLTKPKEIYIALDNFSIKCSDNLKLQIYENDIKFNNDKSNNRYVIIENCGNKSYVKVLDNNYDIYYDLLR